MEIVTIKPERKAQLEEFARQRGKDPAEALDEALGAFFDSEARDFEEAVAGIQRGDEDARAGRHRPAQEFLEELRAKHDLPR
jgi:predicted transcriptional regulator